MPSHQSQSRVRYTRPTNNLSVLNQSLVEPPPAPPKWWFKTICWLTRSNLIKIHHEASKNKGLEDWPLIGSLRYINALWDPSRSSLSYTNPSSYPTLDSATGDPLGGASLFGRLEFSCSTSSPAPAMLSRHVWVTFSAVAILDDRDTRDGPGGFTPCVFRRDLYRKIVRIELVLIESST